MGIALPLALVYMLHVQTLSAFFTLSASIFLTWGVADLISSILERPRLQNRTPTGAIREDWERRQK